MVREELGRTVGVLKVEGGQKRCIFSGRADFTPDGASRTLRGRAAAT